MMFYKLLYPTLAGMALTAMCACTSTSETDEPTANELTFTATQASRSSLVSTENMASFTVYGNMVSSTNPSSPTSVFDGTTVSQTADGWTYDNTQYWFPGQTYSFAAVHFPNSENISNLSYSDDKLTFRYTAPADYTQADDILTAAHRRIYQSPATPVVLNFGHTMARINFVANVDPAVQNVSIVINRIVIKGIATRANYTLQPASITGNSKQTSDLAGTQWTVSQTPARVSYTKEPNVTVSTGASVSLFDSSVDPLLVIPQSVVSEMEVELTYTRVGGTTSTVSGRLRTPASAHGYVWTAGNAYTYSFNLGVDDFLIFDAPGVNAWDEDEGGNYIVVG